MNPDEELHNSDEHREQGSGSRWSLEAWVLWVLASAVGGGAGGATFNIAFVGPLVFFGVILGAAQALVVWRYMEGWAGVRWIAASALGWPAGWLAGGFARLAVQGLVPELFQRPGFEQIVVYRFFDPVVWAVFGVFQCTVLLPILRPALGRQPSRFFFATLWILSSALGGALAVAASFAINATALPSGGGDSFWGVVLPPAVGQAIGGALYGAVTGVVIARIVRQEA